MPGVYTPISTIVDPVADALVTMIEALAVPGLTVGAHKWGPKTLHPRPCAVIELPELARIEPDEAESQLGSEDWAMEFPVVFRVDLNEAQRAQAQLLDIVEAFIAAVDDLPSLGLGHDDEARVVGAGPPEIEDDQTKAMMLYPARVVVARRVAI